MGDIINNQPLRIRYEEGNINDVPTFGDIRLICAAIGAAEGEYLYFWYLNGASVITDSNVVDIRLSHDYCGKLQILKVSLLRKPPTRDCTPVKAVNNTTLFTTFQFLPICKTVEIRDLYFSDETGKAKFDSFSLLAINQNYTIVAEISGYNGIAPEGYLKVTVNGQLKKDFSYQLPKVHGNRLVSPIRFTSKDFPSPTSATIVVEVELYLPAQGLHLEKKTTINVANNPVYHIKRVKPEIQPVVVGESSILESNYHLCRYSQIHVSFQKLDAEICNLKLFDENTDTSVVKPLQLIGGKRELSFLLSNYKVMDCSKKIHQDNHAVLHVFDKTFNAVDLNKYDAQRESSDKFLYPISKEGKVNIAVQYNYALIENYFKFLWNPPLQKGRCHIETCRYSKSIPIVMYPDIEWELTFKFTHQDYSMSFTNVSNEYGRHQRYFKEAQKIGQDRHLKRGEFTVALSLIGTYNDNQKIKLSDELTSAAQKLLDAFYLVYQGLEKFIGRDAATIKARDIPLLGKTSFSLRFISPAFFICGTCKYDYGSKGDILRTGTISLGFDPLIKVEGKIDVLAIFEFYPPYKAIVEFLREGLDLTEKLVKRASKGHATFEPDISVYLIGFGEITASGELSLSKESKSVDLNTKGRAGLGVELSIKADIMFKTVSIFGNKSEVTLGAGMEGKGETSFTTKFAIEYEEGKGCALDAQLTYDGITLSIDGEAYIKITKDKDKTNHNISMGASGTFLKPDGPLWKGTYYIT